MYLPNCTCSGHLWRADCYLGVKSSSLAVSDAFDNGHRQVIIVTKVYPGSLMPHEHFTPNVYQLSIGDNTFLYSDINTPAGTSMCLVWLLGVAKKAIDMQMTLMKMKVILIGLLKPIRLIMAWLTNQIL